MCSTEPNSEVSADARITRARSSVIRESSTNQRARDESKADAVSECSRVERGCEIGSKSV